MDFIGNNLTKIRNAIMARKPSVKIHYSKILEKIAEKMLEYGFIRKYQVVNESNNKRSIIIELKYSKRTGEPVIHEIKRVSTPGRHLYVSARKLPVVKNNMGIAILTTDKGVKTERECRKENIGGELICYIW